MSFQKKYHDLLKIYKNFDTTALFAIFAFEIKSLI